MVYRWVMVMMPSVLLSAALAFTGVPLNINPPQCSNEVLLGEYDPKAKQMSVCTDNIKHHGYNINTVVRHEAIHAIQDNLGMEGNETLLGPKLITFIAREFFTPAEAFTVIYNYEEDEPEFEARIFQNTPDVLVAYALIISSLRS